MGLPDNTVLITGAAGGIGFAIAKAFANEGANVVLNDIDSDRLKDSVNSIRDIGASAIGTPADVADPDDVIALVQEARDRFDQIDVLVNNVGVFPQNSWREETHENWDRTMGINVKGVFNLSKEIVPRMADRGAGAVVNMSSTVAYHGAADKAVYTASKGAIRSLTYQMCREFGPDGVRVNNILPGPIKTELNRELREREEGAFESIDETVPAGRVGEPHEVADLAVFLASSKASYINGTDVVIDGGWTA